MWINLDDQERELIKAMCKHGTHGAFVNLADKLTKAETPDPAHDAYRNAVDTDDDLEVDADAVVSRGGDPGCWVHAWVWVTDEQAGIEPDDEEEEESV
jgi:hypothetical protein